MKSICYFLSGEHSRSYTEIIKAIKGSIDEQLIEPFINKGVVLSKILHKLNEDKSAQAREGLGDSGALFLDRLISAFEENRKKIDQELRKTSGNVKLVNGELSNREVEILSLLVRGKSIKEISSALMVSINTTKSHMKNIYRKFGEHKNKDVIRKAIESGLLD